MKRQNYESPRCEAVELRLDNAVLQASLTGSRNDAYGEWITNEWES